MASSARAEYRRLGVVIAAGLALSLAFGSLWPMVIALSGWAVLFIRQLARLDHWIATFRRDHEPPETSGLWGQVFDRLYHMLRRESAARQELQALIERAESSITALRDAIVVIDRQGRIEYWNLAAEKLLGLREPSDRRQTFTNLVRNPALREYFAEMDFREPAVVAAPGDETRMLEFTVTRFGGGDWLILVRDVTRLHNLEQMRKDFVANVSHELKTPLTVIKGYLETLADTASGQPEAVQRAITQMTGQSERMEALVNDLLLLARLEATEPGGSGEPVVLAPLLEALRDEALAVEPEKEHTLSIEVPADIAVLGERNELRSAFANLLTNAVKYTTSGGTIQVFWQSDERSGALSVKDSGIGIDARHIPRLTERFFRPDTSRVTRTGGTGLGLAIVKHVMMRHDGHLDIASTPGRGSTFSCRFPAERIVNREAAHREH